jgi:hypothetical protein
MRRRRRSAVNFDLVHAMRKGDVQLCFRAISEGWGIGR